MDRAGWLVTLLCASCASSTSVVCEDGSTCPGGFQCDIEHDRCLLPEQVSACAGLAEGADCTFNGAPGSCHFGACEVFFCGDGRITGREQCEGTNLGVDENGEPTTCITAGFYAPDGLACDPKTCLYDTHSCSGGYCGDDEVNGPELCDGTTSKTCVSIGFDAGSVSCDLQCGFQIRDCSRFGWNPESLADVQAFAVAGSGPDDQWAVGLGGKAMHYEGAFWNTWPTGVTNTLIAAWSIGKNDTWAVGLSQASPALAPVVIHWDGTAWGTVSGVPSGDYVDVWAASENDLYIATKANGILHFDGANWSTLGTFSGEPIAIRGNGPNDIYVATKAGPLSHWNGTTWGSTTLTGIEAHFIDANSPTDVWVLGIVPSTSNAMVAHFDGNGWRIWIFNGELMNNIASSAPNDTWLAGVDGIMRHWDGVAWSRSTNIGASPSGLAAVSGFISLSADEVLAVSTLRLAYRYRGQAFGVYKALGPNPFDATQNNAMWGTAADDQYVVNVIGEVWHFDGTDWLNVFTAPAPTKAIAGNASNNVWVGCDDGNLYHWTGTMWATENVATSTIRKVWVSPTGDVWAFTDGTAFHKNGGVWDPYTLGPTPLSVSGTASDDLWVVEGGSPRKLWHWNGSAWASVETGSMTPLLAVVAVTPTDVHVTAEQGRMEHWNGTAWSEQIVAPLADLTMLAATAADDVIAASERDLFHYNGTEWSGIRPPVDFVPNTAEYIPIVGLQASPGRIDMLLQRYRIRTLLRTRPLVCELHEVCSDAVDNDCDGKIDSTDSECP
ncbi:MAG TPA: hypothetical protein VLB44_19750 [Kofleriaceae bacterium]|nr:hypothetical protein [Kofleriaceae bacterium]